MSTARSSEPSRRSSSEDDNTATTGTWSATLPFAPSRGTNTPEGREEAPCCAYHGRVGVQNPLVRYNCLLRQGALPHRTRAPRPTENRLLAPRRTENRVTRRGAITPVRTLSRPVVEDPAYRPALEAFLERERAAEMRREANQLAVQMSGMRVGEVDTVAMAERAESIRRRLSIGFITAPIERDEPVAPMTLTRRRGVVSFLRQRAAVWNFVFRGRLAEVMEMMERIEARRG